MTRHRQETISSLALILLVCTLSFGVQLSRLGFYWDDYASLYVFLNNGSGIFADWFGGQARPLGGLLSGILWEIFGSNPIGWHLINFGLYIASVLLFWRILRLIWSDYRSQTTLMALLFAVYPSYHLRPIPISFNVIISLVIIMFSFWLSLVAVKKNYFLLSMIAALLIPIYQLIYEQNIGYEALRPLVMFYIIFQNKPLPWREWTRYRQRFMILWSPHLIMAALMVIYRAGIFQANETYATYNEPFHLNSLYGWLVTIKLSLAAPAKMLLIDWFHMPWRLFLDRQSDIDLPALLGIIGFFFSLLYLWRFQNLRLHKIKLTLAVTVISLGTMSLLLLAVHLIGRELQDGFNSRWALTPSPLAAVILGIGIPRLLGSPVRGQFVLAGLIALGLGVQVGVNQEYEADWELRQNLGWQMKWRAPELRPDSMFVLITDPETFAFGRVLNDYELTGHSNLYYSGEDYPAVVGADLRATQIIFARNLPRSGNWSDAISGKVRIFRDWDYDLDKLLVFGYDGGCLRTAEPQFDTQSIPDDRFTNLAKQHHPDQITSRALSEQETAVDQNIVEPEHSWCFYYQQIQWAAQVGQDALAAGLADEAQQRGLSGSAIEQIPVIEAYNRVSRFEDAENLVRQVAFSTAHAQEVLCERLQMQQDLSEAIADQMRLLPTCSP